MRDDCQLSNTDSKHASSSLEGLLRGDCQIADSPAEHAASSFLGGMLLDAGAGNVLAAGGGATDCGAVGTCGLPPMPVCTAGGQSAAKHASGGLGGVETAGSAGCANCGGGGGSGGVGTMSTHVAGVGGSCCGDAAVAATAAAADFEASGVSMGSTIIATLRDGMAELAANRWALLLAHASSTLVLHMLALH